MVKLILLLVAANFVTNLSSAQKDNAQSSTEAEIPTKKSGGYLVNHPACSKDLLALAKG